MKWKTHFRPQNRGFKHRNKSKLLLVFFYHPLVSFTIQSCQMINRFFNEIRLIDQKDTISQHLKRATLSWCMLTIHNCIMEPITAKPSWPPETWVVLANIWPCPSVILVQVTQLLNNSDTSPSHFADISSQPGCLKKHYTGSSCFPSPKMWHQRIKTMYIDSIVCLHKIKIKF